MKCFVPLLFAAYGLSLLGLTSCSDSQAGAPFALSTESLAEKQKLPDIDLRGYGKVSGVFFTNEQGGSVLQINCQDEDKARLVQAKFLSDQQVLPGVKPTSIKTTLGSLNALDAEGQGILGALRIGQTVYIPAATSPDAWTTLVDSSFVGAAKNLSSTAEVDVPMWLDRWDKFGFRFYYREWALPEDEEMAKNYDFAKEFEFAEKSNRSGLLFWHMPHRVETAEGLNNGTWGDWAQKAAVDHNLPMAVNLTAGQFVTPVWLMNRYRDQSVQFMPDFSGNVHVIADAKGGVGTLSWNSTTAKDEELGIMQEIVRNTTDLPNVTTYLEPHGELRHGNHDMFVEYGPYADATFRQFLQDKYSDIKTLNTAWDTKFTSWDEIRVPEVAAFAGWNPDSLDLKGTWRIGWEEFAGDTKLSKREMEKTMRVKDIETVPAPKEWFAESFDDSAWPEIFAPGHDRQMFLPRRPAVFRRHFDVPAEWLSKHKRVWLYVWSLNRVYPGKVSISLNGKKLSETALEHTIPHWEAVEVTDTLRAGKNLLAVRLPKGFIAYKVYLSGEEPLQYPNFTAGRNAEWVDFIEWQEWSRVKMAERGIDMIRQVDRNRQIDLMAPDFYADGIKQLALKYGGNFKNTGHMLAFWNDYLPSIMRSAQLPFSLEPGGPSKTLDNFKKKIGLLHTEGVQGLDYFIHIGWIMWPPDIRKHFDENLNIVTMVGKYHSPQAEVAALYSTKGTTLGLFPWASDPNANLRSGYWSWNLRSVLRSLYEGDGLTESSFEDGDAARYRVILDSNTSIMDEKMLGDIEKYVRDGGVFVTFAQTGRHTPTQKDSWPISKLTGYRTVFIDKLKPDGKPETTRSLKPAPGQDVFKGDWSNVKANGLTLEKTADDVVNLLLWEDGSVAAGMRPLGKGYIVEIGCKFSGDSIPDRVEPMDSTNRPINESSEAATDSLRRLIVSILDWQKIKPVPASINPAKSILMRHFISNNGLYDVWSLWNQNEKTDTDTVLQVQTSPVPTWAIDVKTGERKEISDGKIPVSLPAGETRILLTPRNQIAQVSLDWFNLQRVWWRGTAPASDRILPKPSHKFSVDLSNDWAFLPLKDGQSGEAYAAVDFDDSKWERIPLGVWTFPDKRDIKHAVLRNSFTIPEGWTNGESSLWISSWLSDTFVNEGRIWLDGKLIRDFSPEGITNYQPEGGFKPGGKHSLVMEIKSNTSVAGIRGRAWLWYWVKPSFRLDLGGQWQPSEDALTYGAPITLPGTYRDTLSLKRTVSIPKDQQGKRVVLDMSAPRPWLGVIINGRWVSRHGHVIGDRSHLDITPWVKFGEDNEFDLIISGGGGKGEIQALGLNFYEEGVYP